MSTLLARGGEITLAAVNRLATVLGITKLDKRESSGYDAFTIVMEEKVT